MQSLIDQIRQLRNEVAQNDTRPSAEEICARLDLLAAEAEDFNEAITGSMQEDLVRGLGRLGG